MMKLEEIIENWKEDIFPMLNSGNAIFIACFAANGDVLYANQAMNCVVESNPEEYFINPTFKSILNPDYSGAFFNGIITFGNIHSVDNFSIVGKIFRKHDQILLLGELDIQELIDQNKIIRELNSENNNLNRALIQERNTLNKFQIELKESRQKLIEQVATKDTFFSLIAHDLVNPIGAFKSMTQLMYDKYEDFSNEERLQVLGKLVESANNSLELLRNLLDWSRSQRNILTPNITVVDLSMLIKNILFSVKSQSEKKNITITNHLTNGVNVYADKNFLSTIVLNLLSNAVKFTNLDGQINISIEDKDKIIILKIQDDGVGMDAITMDNLFKIESSKSALGTNSEIGTGLGLILCKEFANKMNVSIEVESKVDFGTTFYIFLPKFLNE